MWRIDWRSREGIPRRVYLFCITSRSSKCDIYYHVVAVAIYLSGGMARLIPVILGLGLAFRLQMVHWMTIATATNFFPCMSISEYVDMNNLKKF